MCIYSMRCYSMTSNITNPNKETNVVVLLNFILNSVPVKCSDAAWTLSSVFT
jgi:hypothetical protein